MLEEHPSIFVLFLLLNVNMNALKSGREDKEREGGKEEDEEELGLCFIFSFFSFFSFLSFFFFFFSGLLLGVPPATPAVLHIQPLLQHQQEVQDLFHGSIALLPSHTERNRILFR